MLHKKLIAITLSGFLFLSVFSVSVSASEDRVKPTKAQLEQCEQFMDMDSEDGGDQGWGEYDDEDEGYGFWGINPHFMKFSDDKFAAEMSKWKKDLKIQMDQEGQWDAFVQAHKEMIQFQNQEMEQDEKEEEMEESKGKDTFTLKQGLENMKSEVKSMREFQPLLENFITSVENLVAVLNEKQQQIVTELLES